jgi:hypothetical protein
MSVRTTLARQAQDGYGLSQPFLLAGAPTSGASGSFVGRAVVGSLLIDTSAGKLYIATVATGSTVTWTVVGTQV